MAMATTYVTSVEDKIRQLSGINKLIDQARSIFKELKSYSTSPSAAHLGLDEVAENLHERAEHAADILYYARIEMSYISTHYPLEIKSANPNRRWSGSSHATQLDDRKINNIKFEAGGSADESLIWSTNHPNLMRAFKDDDIINIYLGPGTTAKDGLWLVNDVTDTGSYIRLQVTNGPLNEGSAGLLESATSGDTDVVITLAYRDNHEAAPTF